MALHGHSTVSLGRPKLAHGGSLSIERDPKTLLRFKKALEKAKREGKTAVSAQRALERKNSGTKATDTFNFNPEFASEAIRKKTAAGIARVDSVSAVHQKKVAKLQRLYDIVLSNEINPMSNPPNNQQYRDGVGRDNRSQQLFLGGFLKKVGRLAKSALPLVSLIPGVGTAVGIGATLASQLLSGDGKSKSSSADGLAGVGNTVQIADIAKPVPITGSASFGADFKHGGKLPSKSRNLKDFVADGKARSIGGGAIEFTGPDHTGGGIQLPGVNAEVEGGETLDIIINKRGNVKSRGVPFVFSKSLKVPGSNISFADAHKATVRRGGSEPDIRRLASKQESIAGVLRDKTRPNEFFLGGLIQGAGKFLSASGVGGKILGAASEVLPYVPGIINTIRGATSKVESAKIGPVDRSSVAALTAARDRLARTKNEVRFNPNAAINENRRLLRTITADRNVSDAGKAAAIAGTQTRAAGIRSDFANREAEVNTRLRAEKRRDMLGLTQSIAGESGRLNLFDAQADFQNQQERLAARAARGNLLSTGVSQIGSIFEQRRADRMGEAADERLLNIAMTGRYGPVNDRLVEGLGLEASGSERAEFAPFSPFNKLFRSRVAVNRAIGSLNN